MTALSQDGPAPSLGDAPEVEEAMVPSGGRLVTLLLCDSSGRYLGKMPELAVSTPWWPDTEPVVTEVRRRFGAAITVLRVLDTERPSVEMGGPVTYLAELAGPAPAAESTVPGPAPAAESTVPGGSARRTSP